MSNIVIDDEDLPAVAPTIVVEGGSAVVVDEDAEAGDELPARARRNDDGSITLPLRAAATIIVKSAQHGQRPVTYAELTFYRLTGADIRAINAASEASRGVVTLARSARINAARMDALYDLMDGADVVDATSVVASFFPSGKGSAKPRP